MQHLDLTLAGNPLYDEVESEEVNEVDSQLEEFLKESIIVENVVMILNSYLKGLWKMSTDFHL